MRPIRLNPVTFYYRLWRFSSIKGESSPFSTSPSPFVDNKRLHYRMIL